MRMMNPSRSRWLTALILGALVLVVARGALAEPLPVSFSIIEAGFEQPHSISVSDGPPKQYLDAVKVVVTGQGFTQRNAGPVIWLNGVPTLRVIVAEDGSSLEAYFYQPLWQVEAASGGRWEVQFQDHERANKLLVPGPAEVRRLSGPERARVEALKQKLGIQ